MATKTKEFILSEFLKLLETQEFDRITVTDLVEQCNISRQTFYYHFDDISKMIEWAFNIDTNDICSEISKNDDAENFVALYTVFMNKYDILFKKSINTSQFIFIYNLLENLFFITTKKYFSTVYSSLQSNHEFLIRFWSNAILGYAISEMQKSNSDYESVFKTLCLYIPKTNKD